MGTAIVEVSGVQATQRAAELHAVLTANAQPGDNASPVEVQRSAEMVIAVTILLSDGTRLNLSDVSQDQLEIVFQQDESRRR